MAKDRPELQSDNTPAANKPKSSRLLAFITVCSLGIAGYATYQTHLLQSHTANLQQLIHQLTLQQAHNQQSIEAAANQPRPATPTAHITASNALRLGWAVWQIQIQWDAQHDPKDALTWCNQAEDILTKTPALLDTDAANQLDAACQDLQTRPTRTHINQAITLVSQAIIQEMATQNSVTTSAQSTSKTDASASVVERAVSTAKGWITVRHHKENHALDQSRVNQQMIDLLLTVDSNDQTAYQAKLQAVESTLNDFNITLDDNPRTALSWLEKQNIGPLNANLNHLAWQLFHDSPAPSPAEANAPAPTNSTDANDDADIDIMQDLSDNQPNHSESV